MAPMGHLSLAIFILAAAAGSSGPSAAADEVRAAETAFAKAFADRDRAAFFFFVAEDAHFLSAARTLSGKAQVVEGWSAYFQDARAPFSWRPERVVVNAAGDVGLSTGPVYDSAGSRIGTFSSVWRRDKDGKWKVLFDGPGAPVCPPPEKK